MSFWEKRIYRYKVKSNTPCFTDGVEFRLQEANTWQCAERIGERVNSE